MSDTLAPAHEALEELRNLVEHIDDSAERQGLEAFIECVTPHMMENATRTFLGKIAATIMQDGDGGIPEEASSEEALDALKKHFDVVVE